MSYQEVQAQLPEAGPMRPGMWFGYNAKPLGAGREDVGAVWLYKEAQGSDGVLTDSVVDERPVFLSGPPLQYPNLLRQAGIQGRVLVRAIIDTTGRAEPASVKVVESSHPGFDQAARDFVLHARFSHGLLRGRAVRTLITFPVNFRTAR